MKSQRKPNLKKLILSSGLKQVFIAKQLGITKMYLSMIVTGKRTSQKQIDRIIQFLENQKKAA